jgi:hypothetical protein
MMYMRKPHEVYLVRERRPPAYPFTNQIVFFGFSTYCNNVHSKHYFVTLLFGFLLLQPNCLEVQSSNKYKKYKLFMHASTSILYRVCFVKHV